MPDHASVTCDGHSERLQLLATTKLRSTTINYDQRGLDHRSARTPIEPTKPLNSFNYRARKLDNSEPLQVSLTVPDMALLCLAD